MKKTRLLEIIREEISYALNENYNNSIEEEQLNEIPFIDSPIDITLKNPEKGPNPENIENNALQQAINNAVKVLKQENSDISDSELISTIMKSNTPKNLKGDKFSPEVTNALKGIRDVISKQEDIFNNKDILKSLMGSKGLDTKAVEIIGKYLDNSKSFTDKLGKGQTETAIEKALGKKDTKNQPLFSPPTTTDKKSETPKAEKSAKKSEAPKAEPMDDEDAEALKLAGSDETAKELGSAASVSNNPDHKRILNGLRNKVKKAKGGELSDEDMKLSLNIINKAKDKYKFTPTEVDQLRATIGL